MLALLTDPVSEMAFLGPPSSAYPPDPENYAFYRVGGGFSPRTVSGGGSGGDNGGWGGGG